MFGIDIKPGVDDTQDVPKPKPSLRDKLLRLAKLRDNSPTSDVQAAFKEGERSPIREASY